MDDEGAAEAVEFIIDNVGMDIQHLHFQLARHLRYGRLEERSSILHRTKQTEINRDVRTEEDILQSGFVVSPYVSGLVHQDPRIKSEINGW